MTPIVAFVLFGAVALAGPAYRIYAGRSERTRASVRRTYTNESLMIWWRNWIGVTPFFSLGFLLFGSFPLWPPPMGQVVTSPAVLLVYLAFAASFRVPAPFLPAWLRKEVEEGVTPVARPSRWDWVVLVFVTPLALITIAVAPFYHLMYPNG